MGVILHAHPISGESHTQHNANQEVATQCQPRGCNTMKIYICIGPKG